MRSKKSNELHGSGFYFWIPFLLGGAGVCAAYYRMELERFHLQHASRVADEASGLLYPILVKKTEVFLTYREYWIYEALAPTIGLLFAAACAVAIFGRVRRRYA